MARKETDEQIESRKKLSRFLKSLGIVSEYLSENTYLIDTIIKSLEKMKCEKPIS